MDLPSLCPYCDSSELRYNYTRFDPDSDVALLAFTCHSCGSHLESYAAGFDPPAGDPRWTIAMTPQPTPG